MATAHGGWRWGAPLGSSKAGRILSICNLKKKKKRKSAQLLPNMSPEMEHGERALRKTQINTALGPHSGAGKAKAGWTHCGAWLELLRRF